MKKKIVYITQVCFLDVTVEYIKLIKNEYDVHLIIQLTPNETKSNILNIEVDLKDYPYFCSFDSVVGPWNLQGLSSYFEDCRVWFVVYKHQFKLIDLLNGTKSVYTYVSQNNPDRIHLDDLSGRHLFLIPLLFRYRSKLILNIHDPKLHSGEFSVSLFLIRKIVYKMAGKFVAFSNFSADILRPQVRRDASLFVIKLMPYKVFKMYVKDNTVNEPNLISFVGRISKYKGIELFLEAIKIVITKFPNQRFLIAGKPVHGYSIDRALTDGLQHNLDVVEKHISNEEMVSYLFQSKLIVCPYLDATQSGVILTSYALNKPVLVTRVGGLPEYVEEGVTGLVSELSAQSIAEKIMRFLELDLYQDQSENIRKRDVERKDQISNLSVIRSLYSN